MKVNKKSYSVTLASAVLILFLILVSSTASAVTEQTASLTINKTQITTSGSAGGPSIYGDRIVWRDWRNGYRDSLEEESDVYMYDLSTHKEIRITNRTIFFDYFFGFGPCISGNRILYGRTYDYCIYDISTQKETHIDDMPINNPAFFGNIIVCTSDLEGRPSNIIMYDISTQKETRISSSDSAFSPDIDNNIIVWADEHHEDEYYSSIYMYDLSTKKETQIATSDSAFYYSPAISKDRIVWLDDRGNKYNIYMYNLSTQEETHTNNTSITGFDLYGDKNGILVTSNINTPTLEDTRFYEMR